MTKRIIKIVILIALVIFMTACGGKEPIDFAQKTLQEPSSIEIITNGRTISITKENEKFQRIYDAIAKYWWKYTESEADVVLEDELMEVSN